MRPRTVTEHVKWIGSIDWDRRLFDELIPLPDGTSYNSYLVTGSDKTALVDTVDLTKTSELGSMLDSAGITRLDYIVVNHAEQDHSGSLPYVLDRYPESAVLCTPRAKRMLIDLLHIDEGRVQTVDDGDTVSLGDINLEFIHAAWVHWPETMLTYLREQHVLFSCDLFGSHLATSDLFAPVSSRMYGAAKRYYAEIMMPFHTNIAKHLDRLAEYDIEIIAPSHGPLYDDPAAILEVYRQWVVGPPANKVVIPYVSMHGSTQMLVDRLVSTLADLDIAAVPHGLSSGDIGRLAMELVDAATIVLGTPMVLAGAHPAVVYAAFLANALRPKARFASVIGSFGWGGRAVEQLTGLIPNLNVELLEPVVVKGLPRGAELDAIDGLAHRIAEKHHEAGLL